jgi:hypothetical protein
MAGETFKMSSDLANRAGELLWRYNWEVLDHPPYSPDLAPSNFISLDH